MEALGINICAGTFASGVNQYLGLHTCLNRDSIGQRTAREVYGIECVIEAPSGYCPEFVFGLPRTLYEATELMKFSIGFADVVAFMFDKRITTFGKQYLEWLRDTVCIPNKYRIAHLYFNLLSFGLPINKRVYMFVAYRNDRTFNVAPPVIDTIKTVYDVMYNLCDAADTQYTPLPRGTFLALPLLPCGWSLNQLVQYMPSLFACIPDAREGARMGNNPFGFPSPKRVNWGLPVGRLNLLVHPVHNRPLTYAELAAVACWQGVPVGEEPVKQIMHSGFASVGKWIAEQVVRYNTNEWGEQDYESTYNSNTNTWEGRSTTNSVEKTFNLNEYVGAHRHHDEFPTVPRRIRFLGNKWIPANDSVKH